MQLGVNIDHTATLREARHTRYPDPAIGALMAEYGGADSIVAHLREDRRHIKERDVYLIKEIVSVPFNLEMSVSKSVVACALDLKPHKATLVPERRKELTTEGGLDVAGQTAKVKKTVERLQSADIEVSLFIEPSRIQIDKTLKTGARLIELHTGKYADSTTPAAQKKELSRIVNAARYARKKGLNVAAGHGLDYENVKKIAAIKDIEELNIGHSIICHALYLGLVSAVEKMKELVSK